MNASRGSARAGFRSGVQLRDPPRRLLIDGLHLATLWAFGVAQPLFDLLGRNAAFFAIRGSPRWDIVLFAVGLVTLVPLALLAIEVMVALVSQRGRRAVHLVFVAALAALFALQVLKRTTGGTSTTLLPAAAVLGAAVAAVYALRREARALATALSPAPLVFLVLFLAFSPVHELVLPGGAGTSAAKVASRTPVVVILFDELPVTSLLSAPSTIDAGRYPSFAALARHSNWFVNTASVDAFTEAAIPAVLTGNRPEKGDLPTAADHPESIFTLFGASHRLKVWESITHICPPELCERRQPDFRHRMSSLVSDLTVVELHQLLPEDLEARLPSISSSWQDFRGGPDPGGSPATAAQPAVGKHQDRVAAAMQVIDAIPSDERGKPPLALVHFLVPHVPWQYLPSGRQYGDADLVAGLDDEHWGGDRRLSVQGYQRHLLQVGFTDRLLGRIIRRLRDKRLYDRSLIVVAADHGVSLSPGGPRRDVTAANVADIAPVPLFIKTPHQRSQRIIRTQIQTIDIVPTVADLLDVKMPWKVDGRSAFAPGAARRRITMLGLAGRRVVVDARRLAALRARALSTKLALFGSGRRGPGLYGVGPERWLVGRPVSGFRVSSAPGLAASIDQAALLARVDPRSDFVPAHVTGELSGGAARAGMNIALAVNGRVAATTATFRFLGRVTFSAMVPESSLRRGANQVQPLIMVGRGPRLGFATVGGGRTAPTYALAGGSVRSSGGRRLRIASEGVISEVGRSQVVGDAAQFSGFATRANGDPVTAIVVFSGRRFVGAFRPSVDRPDVAEHFGQDVNRSGYTFEVPLRLLGSDRSNVELYGITDRIASPLPYNCSREPQDFGCAG